MIGFGWLARDKYPELKPYYNDRNLQMLAGWAVICVFLDYFNIMKIGNVAHVMGAAGGALVALSFIRKMWIARIGLIIVTIAAFIPVYWNPRSPNWNFAKAYDAHGRKDYDTAIRFYHRCDELGMSDMAVWHNIAIIEGYRQHKPEYKAAIARLRKIAPNDAAVVVRDYGEPN
jgi:hypothetical protein